MSRKIKNTLARKIMRATDRNIEDKELVDALLEEKIFVSNSEDELTFGDKSEDFLAKFAGSWLFIISFCVFLALWIVANMYLLSAPFDPYPFILLNLILSCLASVQAPLIMMSQNRQEEKDRRRAESEYKISLKTQMLIEDIHARLDKITAIQMEIVSKSENNVTEVEKEG